MKYKMEGIAKITCHEEVSKSRVSAVLEDNDVFWQCDNFCQDMPGIDRWLKLSLKRPLLVSGLNITFSAHMNLPFNVYIKPYEETKTSKTLLEHCINMGSTQVFDKTYLTEFIVVTFKRVGKNDIIVNKIILV